MFCFENSLSKAGGGWLFLGAAAAAGGEEGGGGGGKDGGESGTAGHTQFCAIEKATSDDV